MPKTKALRDETKYRLLPQLDPETYAGLKANIALNGVQVPVVRDEKGYILDGFARAKITKELGYECPSVVAKGLTEQEKRSQVRALNLARRQLDNYAKRQIIADELRENPDRSNWWIAKSLGVDHKTVASVRTPMGATGDFPGWVIHSVRTASTDLRPGAACRRTGMADCLISFPVLENVSTSTSTMKKASSGLRLRSGSGGSQNGSRGSRSDGNNPDQYE